MPSRPTVPSLFADAAPAPSAAAGAACAPPVAPVREAASSLLDLLYDGFYMVFLLRRGHAPGDAEAFRDRIKRFLAAVEQGGRAVGASADDVHLARFAYCALIDEVVLASQRQLRDVWQRRPLQLEFFGEQLAGERFFDHLEVLRHGGAARLQALEVFHMCLLLGFQGRYLFEGPEKLDHLVGRLGDEIAYLRGRQASFAPHAAAPDRTAHALKSDVPLWTVGSVFALAGLLAFGGLRWSLERQTQDDLAPYRQVVQLAPEAAHVTITLP